MKCHGVTISNETSLVALSHGLLVPYYVFSRFTTRNLKVLNFNFGYHILGCKCQMKGCLSAKPQLFFDKLPYSPS